ncbi:MAG TPA: hypothetical protein DCS91_09985 [Microcoleaceae bacterium UBA11344]|nr:hypothetical protein [Microcoleaceae cyanobacterium UBA11344]
MPSSLASQKGKLTGMNSGVAGKLFDDSRLCLNPRGIHPHYTPRWVTVSEASHLLCKQMVLSCLLTLLRNGFFQLLLDLTTDMLLLPCHSFPPQPALSQAMVGVSLREEI